MLETKWQNKNLSEISWHTLLIENGKNNLEYNIRQFTQEHHIIQAALAGQGFALVSSFLVQNAVAQGWLVKYNVTEKSNKANGFCYYLVIPEHNRQSKIIMAFKDWIVSELVIENATIVKTMPVNLKRRGFGLDFGYRAAPSALIDCGLANERDIYFDQKF